MVFIHASSYLRIEGADVCLFIFEHVWVFVCVYTLSVVENVNICVFECICVHVCGVL